MMAVPSMGQGHGRRFSHTWHKQRTPLPTPHSHAAHPQHNHGAFFNFSFHQWAGTARHEAQRHSGHWLNIGLEASLGAMLHPGWLI